MSENKMTQEQFVEKYGEGKVKFSSYYKYTFIFTNGKGLSLSVGGDSDDIYRFAVEIDKEYTIKEFCPTCAYLDGESLGYWF